MNTIAKIKDLGITGEFKKVLESDAIYNNIQFKIFEVDGKRLLAAEVERGEVERLTWIEREMYRELVGRLATAAFPVEGWKMIKDAVDEAAALSAGPVQVRS